MSMEEVAGGPTPDQVEHWLQQVDSALLGVQQRLEPLLAEQTRLNDRRQLLKELLASFDDRPTDPLAGPSTAQPAETTRERVHRQAAAIFQELERSLHTNDIHAEFLRRGYEVPGAGKPNNITVHLTGWPDIASPERGVYGLVQHVGEQRVRTAPRRRRKRRA